MPGLSCGTSTGRFVTSASICVIPLHPCMQMPASCRPNNYISDFLFCPMHSHSLELVCPWSTSIRSSERRSGHCCVHENCQKSRSPPFQKKALDIAAAQDGKDSEEKHEMPVGKGMYRHVQRRTVMLTKNCPRPCLCRHYWKTGTETAI